MLGAAETGAAETGAGEAGDAEHVQSGASEHNSKAQIFQVTISLRDDWLHRGDALQDMDLQTYAEYIQRRAKPVCGQDIAKVLRRQVFAFDPHYKLAQGYMQVLMPGNQRGVARFNMANCEKENVNEGEENAQFKAMHCTLLRCPGVGLCADPLMCAATLFPNAQGDQGRCASRPPRGSLLAPRTPQPLRGGVLTHNSQHSTQDTTHDTRLTHIHTQSTRHKKYYVMNSESGDRCP